jgi:hypothetical protein
VELSGAAGLVITVGGSAKKTQKKDWDGVADLVWRRPADGTLRAWLLDPAGGVRESREQWAAPGGQRLRRAREISKVTATRRRTCSTTRQTQPVWWGRTLSGRWPACVEPGGLVLQEQQLPNSSFLV